MTKLRRCAIAAVLFCASAVAQTASAKLDHVIIAVQDLEAAKRVYSWLGFSTSESGRHPGGTQNSVACLARVDIWS